MFKSAALKLTVFYFVLLLFVCITFSIPAYSIASQRITRGAENQEEIFREYGNRPAPPANTDNEEKDEKNDTDDFDPTGTIRERIDKQIRLDQQELLRAIILANVLILSLGTVLCYLFAKRTLKPIEESHEAQSRFTADASHELRTPLTVMKAEIEVALLQDLKAKELREVLSSNLEEIERLSALSNQLLALTRVDDDSIEMHSFDFSSLVDDEISSLEKQFGISIEKTVEPGITFKGVEPLCKDLLNILVSNAVQYAGDNPPEVSVSLTRRDKAIKLAVSDKGIGISDEDLPHIFERFYRGAHAAKNRVGGHGLGLSLASEIVERHAGNITATSERGKGTVFTVIF